MKGFFFDDKQKQEYAKEHNLDLEEKPKRTRKISSRKLSSKDYKPKHFDTKLETFSPPSGKLLQQMTFFTEEGLKLGFVYHLDSTGDSKFQIKMYDANFNVTEQYEYDTQKECVDHLRSMVKGLELEESGLVKCMRDVLTKTNELNKDIMFMFRLLLDPDIREEYEVKSAPVKPSSTQSTQKEHKTIKNHKSKYHKSISNNKSLKHNNVRDKIKGLSLLRKEKEDDHTRDYDPEIPYDGR